MPKIKLITKIGGKALPPHGGNGKIPDDIPHLRHHDDDGLDTNGAGKPAKISEWSMYLWNESHNEFGAKVTVIISVTANAVHCHRRGHCRKWLRKIYVYSNNIRMSDEDNNHDTNCINKHKYTNHDTRKLHLWAQHVERAVSVLSWCRVTRTSWFKMFLSLTSSHLHTWASLLDLTFLPFYFDLTFPVFFHSSVLMHPEPHTNLDNLNTVQNNLRHSAKVNLDAYDVTHSLTQFLRCSRRNVWRIWILPC